MALYLAIPARKHRRAWVQLKQEFVQDGAAHHALYQGSKTFGQFLRKRRDFAQGKRLPEGYVPGSKYFLMEEGSPKILGVIDIRHWLNDYLLNNPGGHIGYAIAPSERRRGYATEQLRLALEICKTMGIGPVLITCHKDNIASARVIQNNGGVLEDERVSREGKVFQRYWIEV